MAGRLAATSVMVSRVLRLLVLFADGVQGGGSWFCAGLAGVVILSLLALCFGAEAACRRGAAVAAALLAARCSGLFIYSGVSRRWWLAQGRRSAGFVPGRAGQLLIGSCFAGGNCGSQSHRAMVLLLPLVSCPAFSSGAGVRPGEKTMEDSDVPGCSVDSCSACILWVCM